MTLATDLVHDYRFAVRHLWNNYFWCDEGRRDFRAHSSFRQLKAPLFRALVGDPLGHTPGSDEEIFGERFVLKPVNGGASFAPLDIDVAGDGVFQRVEGASSTELRLVLLDCWDWLSIGYWDLHYFQARVDHFESRPELVGRSAIVEVTGVDVLWDDR